MFDGWPNLQQQIHDAASTLETLNPPIETETARRDAA